MQRKVVPLNPGSVRKTIKLMTIYVELWRSIPRVAFLAFTKTNKILKEKLS
jgi:hypothetical protein